MITVNRALKSDRLMSATAGLSAPEFNQLVQSFGQELQKEGWIRYRNVQNLTHILEKVLDKKMVLPKRKISTLEGLFELFPNVKDLFIDGTERPIQRLKDSEKQKESYSGKKKAHTCKNIVVGAE
jgi:hypothetical protein